jgi:hypothetical protein
MDSIPMDCPDPGTQRRPEQQSEKNVEGRRFVHFPFLARTDMI